MKTNANPKCYPLNNGTSYAAPGKNTIAIPLLLFGKKKRGETTEQPAQEKPKSKPALKGTAVDKYELSNGLVKFSTMKGFFKKRWIVIKEIPTLEISSVDSFGNQLNITWNGTVYQFVLRKETQSFSGLRDQIIGLLADQQATIENNQKTSALKADLVEAITTSIGTIDLSFDILMGLHEKRVNWSGLEGYTVKLGNSLSYNGSTLPPLAIDLSRISLGVKNQVPKEVSKEVFTALKSIYGYFNSLTLPDDITASTKNLETARTVLSAYYTLNDIVFAKATGQKDDVKEFSALENTILSLANESNIKVNIDTLKALLGKISYQAEGEVTVDDVRALFKDQLKLF